MKARVAVLAGDGIGPEVIAEGSRCLAAVGRLFGHDFALTALPFGGAAIEIAGNPLPEETLAACLASDAVLLGAIGGPKWSAPDAPLRPEAGLLRLRKELGAFANLRPVRVHPALTDASTLRAEVVRGVDLLFVRELTGGIYFGDKRRDAEGASDVCTYTVSEIERIVRVAARLAAGRRGGLTSIDKSNVLETSRLWREVTQRIVSREFPLLTLDHMLVDAAAMHLIRSPRDFDVLVTENMFGDILTDEASMLAGSLGLLPSASLGSGRRGIYEPIHGSAPDIAGRGVANPYGAILSVALLLRHSLELHAEAAALEQAVDDALAQGARTADLAPAPGRALSTREAGAAVLSRLRRPAAERAPAT
jgi:3-isopropylmalate dehydrogenase